MWPVIKIKKPEVSENDDINQDWAFCNAFKPLEMVSKSVKICAKQLTAKNMISWKAVGNTSDRCDTFPFSGVLPSFKQVFLTGDFVSVMMNAVEFGSLYFWEKKKIFLLEKLILEIKIIFSQKSYLYHGSLKQKKCFVKTLGILKVNSTKNIDQK